MRWAYGILLTIAFAVFIFTFVRLGQDGFDDYKWSTQAFITNLQTLSEDAENQGFTNNFSPPNFNDNDTAVDWISDVLYMLVYPILELYDIVGKGIVYSIWIIKFVFGI